VTTPTLRPHVRHAAAEEEAARPWTGPTRPYDLVKEFVAALAAVAVLTVVLAVVFSSPDVPQVTLSQWAKAAPGDFVATAATELDGTSGTATYGAPYSRTAGAAQKIGPISLQHLAGVTIPVHTATDFVVRPLQGVPGDAQLTAALSTWKRARVATQQQWASAYDDALQKAPDNDPAKVAAGDYGPVPLMLDRLLGMARSGGLDGALLAEGSFYQTDYTKPLLFIADGSYLEDLARGDHLGGDQWGMMNETGNYPGQAWLWLYSFWYQIPPFKTSEDADAQIWAIMAILSLALVCVPFIPGVRSIPRWVPVYRLIWRDYYRRAESRAP
jgi:hypothetical protein